MSFTARATAALATATLTVGLTAGAGVLAPAAAAAPTSCDELEIISHRGYATAGVDENTVAAFDAARDRGFSIETDVRVDADGVLWLFHDRETTQLTGTPGFITAMSTTEVEGLRYTKAGSPLLRLTEALDRFQTYSDTRVYLEPKGPDIAEDVARLVVARGQTSSTYITDFVESARAGEPAVQVLAKVFGTLPESPRRYVRAGVDIVAAPAGRLVPATVARYQRRGIEVQGRNAKATSSWRGMIRAGADGQLTKRPAALAAFCPVALKAPLINSRKSKRTGPRMMAIRGKFFYDVASVRVADRTVRYQVISPRHIGARIKGIKAKRVSVSIRTPNGVVERTVFIGRR